MWAGVLTLASETRRIAAERHPWWRAPGLPLVLSSGATGALQLASIREPAKVAGQTRRSFADLSFYSYPRALRRTGHSRPVSTRTPWRSRSALLVHPADDRIRGMPLRRNGSLDFVLFRPDRLRQTQRHDLLTMDRPGKPCPGDHASLASSELRELAATARSGLLSLPCEIHGDYQSCPGLAGGSWPGPPDFRSTISH